MTRRRGVPLAALLMLAVLSCSSEADSEPEASHEHDDSHSHPHADEKAPPIEVQPHETDEGCLRLTGKPPSDLTKEKVNPASDGDGVRSSDSIIWTNANSSRVVNIHSADTRRPGGDPLPSAQDHRLVNGVRADVLKVGEVHLITWRPPEAGGPCVWWTLTVQGLKPGEVTKVLESIRESD